MGIIHDKYIDAKHFIYKKEVLKDVPENIWSIECEDIDFNTIKMEIYKDKWKAILITNVASY